MRRYVRPGGTVYGYGADACLPCGMSAPAASPSGACAMLSVGLPAYASSTSARRHPVVPMQVRCSALSREAPLAAHHACFLHTQPHRHGTRIAARFVHLKDTDHVSNTFPACTPLAFCAYPTQLLTRVCPRIVAQQLTPRIPASLLVPVAYPVPTVDVCECRCSRSSTCPPLPASYTGAGCCTTTRSSGLTWRTLCASRWVSKSRRVSSSRRVSRRRGCAPCASGSCGAQ